MGFILSKGRDLILGCENCLLLDVNVVNGSPPGVWFLSFPPDISGVEGIGFVIAWEIYWVSESHLLSQAAMQGTEAKAGLENIPLALCITHSVAVSCCRDHGICGWEGSQALPVQVGLSGAWEHTPVPLSVSMERGQSCLPPVSQPPDAESWKQLRPFGEAPGLYMSLWTAFCIVSLTSAMLLVLPTAVLLHLLWALWASRRRQNPALSTSWNLQKCLVRLQLSGKLCLDPSISPQSECGKRAVPSQPSAGSIWGCSQVVKHCSSSEKGRWTGAQWYRFLLQALWTASVQGHGRNDLGWKATLKIFWF